MHADAKNAKNAMHGQKPHAFLGKNHTYAGAREGYAEVEREGRRVERETHDPTSP